MLLLITFAFLGGVVTILSPCILPILPVVLSSSLTGGKSRPLGVVTGFILSFTFFTLFLSLIVKSLGISADVLRSFSIIVIALFGIGLLLPNFQAILERLFTFFSRFSPKLGENSGFSGGLLIGVSIGLIWTPCVGPILASIISLAITGTVTSQAALITLSYSLGTAIPMLAIVYGGRNLLNKVPWLTRNTIKIQKGFGVLMILTALAIFFNFDRKFQTYILDKFPSYGTGLTSLEDNEIVRRALDSLGGSGVSEENMGKPMFDLLEEKGEKSPELIQGGQWFNSDPLKLSELRGKVVMVDFWTYTCINCIRTLPYLRDWHEKYSDKGLVIIGVHTPEFEFEKDPDNLQKAIDDYQLKYPIMQDNDYATWRAYANRYWPAKYIVDKEGYIRYTHFGEGAYDETEEVIQALLSEMGEEVNIPIKNPEYKLETRTPELYLGIKRASYFASTQGLKQGKGTYSFPDELPIHHFAFDGEWDVHEEFSSSSAGSKLTLGFEAKEVYLVMRKEGEMRSVRISFDEKLIDESVAGEDVKDGVVEVSTNRLYELVKLPKAEQHTITLEFLDAGIEIYAFTFG